MKEVLEIFFILINIFVKCLFLNLQNCITSFLPIVSLLIHMRKYFRTWFVPTIYF